MPATGDPGPNTPTLISRLHIGLSRQVVDGVVAAGHPIRASHSVVFGQLGGEGARLTELARGANMTPQAMGELVDELEELGYVVRRPDPSDRRAKLIMLTASGRDCLRDGIETIATIERSITETLGARGHRQLRDLLSKLLEQQPAA
jgi:DNA-binding MarR family transcriptional regulator